MATRTISAKITVEGEKKFNEQLSAINRNLRAMSAELKAEEAAFRANGGSLKSLSNAYQAQQNILAQQKEKVRALEEAYRSLDAAGKGNSQSADDYRRKLNLAKAEMHNTEAAMKKTRAAMDQLRSGAKSSAKAVGELGTSAEQGAKGIGVMGVALGNVLANLGQRGVQLLKEIGQTGISYNAQMEKYSVALTTALGNTEAAASAIEAIRQDAAATPYSMDGLVQANSLLISTGESAEEARATIMALSNAVSATGGGNDELNRMAFNLQQIKNTGQAATVDIKQFAMAGIDIYGVLADYTGKSTEEVKEMTISYQMLSKALQAAAQEGGRYFGANAAQAETLNGQLSTLADNAKMKLGEAFEGVSNTLRDRLLPAANEFVNGLDIEKILADFDKLLITAAAAGGALAAIKAAAKINDMASDFRNVVSALTSYRIGLGATAIAEAVLNKELTVSQVIYGTLGGAIDLATVKQLALNAATTAFPGAAVVAAITGVIVGIKALNDQAAETTDQLLGDVLENNNIEEVKSKLEELRAEYARVEAEFNTAYSEVTWFDVKALGDAVSEAAEHYDTLVAKEQEHQAYLASAEGKTETLTNSMQELMMAYEESYNAARSSLEGQFDLFEQVGQQAILSTDQMIAGMNSQAEYYNQYADNLNMIQGLTGGALGFNEALVASLNDGSAQSVQYAASLVAGYQEALAQGEGAAQTYIDNINAAYEGQQAALDSAAKSMAESQTNFDKVTAELAETAAQMPEDMNQAEEMKTSADETIQAYIDGLSEKEGPLVEMASALGAAVSAAFNSNVSFDLPDVGGAGGGSDGSGGSSNAGGRSMQNYVPGFATGLERVPYDNFLARLHKDEMVLTARDAEMIRRAGGRAHNVTNIYLYPQTVDEGTIDYIYNRFSLRLGQEV